MSLGRLVANRRQFRQELTVTLRLLDRAGEQRGKRVQTGGCGLEVLEVRDLAERLRDPMQRARALVRRALEHEHRLGQKREPLAKRAHDTRLADPRLAGNHRDLAFADLGATEQRLEQPDFVITTDERSQAIAVESLETRLGADRITERKALQRHRSAVDCNRSEIGEGKKLAQDSVGARADDDAAALRLARQGGGEEGRAAGQVGGIVRGGTRQHGPGKDPDAHAQRPAHRAATSTHSRVDVEGAPNRPLRIGLVRLGKSETCKDLGAPAGDTPGPMAVDGCVHDALERPDQRGELFGIL